jgi:hypothetical protein
MRFLHKHKTIFHTLEKLKQCENPVSDQIHNAPVPFWDGCSLYIKWIQNFVKAVIINQDYIVISATASHQDDLPVRRF